MIMEKVTTKKRRLDVEETNKLMIQNILENFDFHKCRKAMTALKWEWAGRGVPTIEEIRKSAIDRLECAIEGCLNREDHKSHKEPYFCSSGGLKATAWRNKYHRIEYLLLEFVLTEWNTDGDYLDEE